MAMNVKRFQRILSATNYSHVVFRSFLIFAYSHIAQSVFFFLIFFFQLHEPCVGTKGPKF